MLTEGKVRAIAFSVAAALIRKIKPENVSETFIEDTVRDVIDEMKQSGELAGGSYTLTETDKQAIVADVLAALPAAEGVAFGV